MTLINVCMANPAIGQQLEIAALIPARSDHAEMRVDATTISHEVIEGLGRLYGGF